MERHAIVDRAAGAQSLWGLYMKQSKLDLSTGVITGKFNSILKIFWDKLKFPLEWDIHHSLKSFLTQCLSCLKHIRAEFQVHGHRVKTLLWRGRTTIESSRISKLSLCAIISGCPDYEGLDILGFVYSITRASNLCFIFGIPDILNLID
ncbi:hypothetical protein Tco_0953881 [Tanacetum coccineum]|uniref:Uncharacterized protein n=1 Tax=Tanacetum coccineum TaxID=301880 RepID=A0ABQ5E3G6_9ASTR